MKCPVRPLAASPAVLLLLLAVGCGGDGASGADASDTAQDTADGAADTYTPPTNPILERAPQNVATCAVSSALTRIPDATWYPTSLAQTSGGVWLAYGGWQRGGYQAAVATLTPAGVFGAPLALDDLGETIYLAADGDRLAVSFDRLSSGGHTQRFAVANADGTLAVPARDADATGPLAAVDGGFVQVSSAADPGGNAHLALRVLDDDGDTAVGPVAIATVAQQWGVAPADLAAVPGGVAVAWSERDPAAVRVAWYDAEGAVARAPVTLGGQHGEGWLVVSQVALLPLGDALWVSWAEASYGTDFADGRAEIRVAVIDADGVVREAPLSAAEVDVYRTAPRLVDHGGVPGLAWSEGTFIYICAGCISDYDVHFLLLGRDAAGDVVPASPVTVIPHQTNGIYTRFLAPLGDDVLFVTQLDFHAISYPALATITCDDAN